MTDIKEIIKEAENYIKDYVKQSGANGVVLGISGGIDSAVVKELAINVLGKDKVKLINMPLDIGRGSIPNEEGYHSIYDRENGKGDICINKIDNILYEFKIATKGLSRSKLTEGNLMARIRMCILYMYANEYNYLVIGTTNLSEMVIGYYTKYGDGGVDFEPIGHITKTTIRKMAKELGVSQEIIDKIPSADLWDGQTDEDEMGFTYEDLDEYIKDGAKYEPVHTKIDNMCAKAEHKKHMPPSLDVIR